MRVKYTIICLFCPPDDNLRIVKYAKQKACDEHKNKAKRKRWVDKHREMRWAGLRRYRHRHAKQVSEYKNSYYAEHRDAILKQKKEYYEEHRDEILRKKREKYNQEKASGE